jgi:hypothetical protein
MFGPGFTYSANVAEGSLSTIAGGGGNVVAALAVGSTIGGGWQNSIQDGTTNAVIGGGQDNVIGPDARHAVIGGGRTNVIKSGASRSIIAGGEANTIDEGAYLNVIGGGGGNRIYSNAVAAVIGGGSGNKVVGRVFQPTICGGVLNTVETSAYYTVIGGGGRNTIRQGAQYAVIDGGRGNEIERYGQYCAIGGGDSNRVSSYVSYATVPGGKDNLAGGYYSFAAGRRALATNDGAFVWGDSTDADVASTAANQFVVRASGGVYVYSDAAMTTGVVLYAGSGSWTSLSDENAKEDFRPVAPGEVLERLQRVPIRTWKYKAQDASVRHLGPTAQDFYEAFGVGDSPTGITTVDANGVALAAIQGLYQENQELKAELAGMKRRMDELEGRME